MSLRVFSFAFPSYFPCIFVVFSSRPLNAVVRNWNVKEWFQLALSSSSTSLRVFSFASSSALHQQKPPSLLSSRRQPPKNGFVICVIAFTWLSTSGDQILFPRRTLQNLSLFVFLLLTSGQWPTTRIIQLCIKLTVSTKMSAADMDHSHIMKNPGHQINAQLVAATFRTSFTAKK